MDLEELRKRFAATYKLAKQIRGQRLLTDADEKAFTYGNPGDVPAGLEFRFVYHFGGFPGKPIRTPLDGVAWIKSMWGDKFYWEVRRQDLDDNYTEVEERG